MRIPTIKKLRYRG